MDTLIYIFVFFLLQSMIITTDTFVGKLSLILNVHLNMNLKQSMFDVMKY